MKAISAGSWMAPPVTETWRMEEICRPGAVLDVWGSLPLISGTTSGLLSALCLGQSQWWCRGCVWREPAWTKATVLPCCEQWMEPLRAPWGTGNDGEGPSGCVRKKRRWRPWPAITIPNHSCLGFCNFIDRVADLRFMNNYLPEMKWWNT